MQGNLANGTMGHTDWQSIDWKQANRVVRNLRQRIFKATQAGDNDKVRQLQKLMLRCHSNTLVSVRRVTQVNAGKKTAGVDKVVVKTAQAREELIETIQSHQPWRISPVKRVYIPKSNGKKRPLGIPTVIDRVHQARAKNALEPQWEANFEGTSYGFRPGRSAHDAIMACYSYSRPTCRKKWILDADIKGAFDNIDHEFLLNAITSFPAKELVKQWLKAGSVEDDKFISSPSGTPQGGIISPLLANIALHGMEKALGVVRSKSGNIKGKRGIVRYADDFVVFCESREDAEKTKEELSKWLATRGLIMSEEKTRIVHITEGFDYLGFNIRQYSVTTTRTGYKLLITPSAASIQAIKNRLKSEWRNLVGHNVLQVIKRLNPIISGWANYFRMANSTEAFESLHKFMYNQGYRWAKRTHPKKGTAFIHDKYFGRLNKKRGDNWVFGDKESGAYLKKFRWFAVQRHAMVIGTSSKDDPTLAKYWMQREARKGQKLKGDTRILARIQSYQCPICGESLFNGEEMQDHHVIMDKSHPERHYLKNRRLVHLFCHQQIHYSTDVDLNEKL